MCPVSVSMCLIRLETASCLFNMRAELSSNVGRDCWDMISPATLTNPAKKMPGTGAAVPLATLINSSIGWVGHHNFYLQVPGLSSEILRSYFIWVFGGEIKCIFPSACDTAPAPFSLPGLEWRGLKCDGLTDADQETVLEPALHINPVMLLLFGLHYSEGIYLWHNNHITTYSYCYIMDSWDWCAEIR